MKRGLRKGLMLIIAVMALSVCFVFGVSAEEYSGSCGDNLTWTLDSETGVLTISGEGDMKNFNHHYTDNVYVGISSPWYEYKSYIKSLIVSDGVTSIGNNAFYGCGSLEKAIIGNSVKTVGDAAFSWCAKLVEVTIGNGVITIGDEAFYSCLSLAEVTIPDNVVTIGADTFSGCGKLTEVIIGCSLATIGGSAFTGCDRLESITVDKSNEYYSSDEFGVLFNKEKTILVLCPDTKTFYEIPDGVTIIGIGAFYQCENLTSIIIPKSVTTVENVAFYECTSLTDVYFAGSEKEWNQIDIYIHNNEWLTEANIHYYLGCEHIMSDWSTVTETTCGKSGREKCYCIYNCGYIEEREIEKSEHTMSLWTTDYLPTCQNTGRESRYCINACGHIETREIAISEHLMLDWSTDYLASCTSVGCESRYCKYGCGYAEYRDTPMIKHSMGGWIVSSSANCTSSGMRYRECIYGCGETEKQVIKETGHSFTKYIYNNDATCTEDGTKTAKCDYNCGETDIILDEGTAPGHKLIYHEGKQATCSEIGWDEYHTCEKCDYSTYTEYGLTYDHKYKETGYIPPNCYEDGRKVYICMLCGEWYEEYIPHLNHNFSGEPVLKMQATCREPAYYIIPCINNGCNESIVAPIDSNLGDHESYIIDERPATCTEDGLRLWKCHLCGFEETETVKASHNMGEWYVYINATCTSDGEKRRNCINCEYYDSEVIESSDHSFTKYVSDENATCIADGTKTAKCDNAGCNATDTLTDEGTRKGHTYGDWYREKDPTCTEAGNDRRDCIVCYADYETSVIPSSGHIYGDWYREKDPTCTKEGNDKRNCINCSHYEIRSVGTAGHKMNGEYVRTEPTCTKKGVLVTYCTECGYEKTSDIAKISHGDHNADGYCDVCGENIAQAGCSCNCHKGGFMGFIWKILRFFQKLFKTNQFCVCGAAHY